MDLDNRDAMSHVISKSLFSLVVVLFLLIVGCAKDGSASGDAVKNFTDGLCTPSNTPPVPGGGCDDDAKK
jgi:hypothetical protein